MDELLKNNLFATHAVAAAGYLALGTVLTYPLDTLKALIQVGSGPSKHLNPGHVVQRVQTFSGNSGLYRGIEWLILGRIPGVGARFGVYQLLTAFYKDSRIDNVVYVSEALMAGVAAGVMESLVSSPFEIIKLRGQVTSASRISSSTSFVERSAIYPLIARVLSGYSPDVKAVNNSVGLLSTLTTKYPNMIDALKECPWMLTGSGRPPSVIEVRRPSDIFSFEGIGAFWRGLRSGVARDSISVAFSFLAGNFYTEQCLNGKPLG